MSRSNGKQFNPDMSDFSGDVMEISPSVLASLPMGVVAFAPDLRVIHANDIAAELLDLGESLDRSLAVGGDQKVWGDWKSSLDEVVETGQTATFDSVEYSRPDSVRLLRIIITPLKSHSTNQITGGIAVIEDITGKDNIANELSQAERLAAIGKVAGKVAHELNNPMDGILRYINLSIRAIENKQFEKPVGYLSQCRSGLMRMVRIIGELLEFSRGMCPTLQFAPIEKIVTEAVKAMEPKCSGVDIAVIDDLKIIDKKFRGDNLFQVFCNLIKNAADAIQGDGSLDITISGTADEIAVEFKDTGPGFLPEHAESIFEPFFTTKAEGAGTGLGLAICKDIIEKYKGRIEAINNAQGGSIFTVYLPTK
ncbi:MAG: PAS domain-containing protein [Planctomycetes bacterium]|nr:PAS domain-containing protein [Planctomycetota bacterium]